MTNPPLSTAPPLQVSEALTGEHPGASIIIMHGLGADGSDFFPIAEQMDLSSIGAIRYLFPNAPVMSVTVNGGYQMPAWYDILGTDLARREDEAGLRQSQRSIEALIENEIARGIPASKIVLAGFSQGCAMALMTGLRYTQQLAGIAGLSGYLPLAEKTAKERAIANQGTSIFLAHGRQDPVVTMDRAQASRTALSALGYAIEWHDYPMEHSVCLEEIRDLRDWLLKVLA
jgi:phospholipase/carboxylesterase